MNTHPLPEDLSWVDRYWPIPCATRSKNGARPIVQRVASMAMVHRIVSTPSPANIADALAARPDAAKLLETWREAWGRAFDGSIIEEGTPEASRWDMHVVTASLQEEIALEDGEIDKASLNRATMGIDVSEHRDARLHIIDDAASFLSYRLVRPGEGYLTIDMKSWYVLAGHHPDGMPIFESILSSQVREIIRTRTSDYWTSPAFHAFSGRLMSEARGTRSGAMVLTAMARAGHGKAFVKAKTSKVGTWTVDLDGIVHPRDAAGRLGSTLYPISSDTAMLVQEHVPFTHEQRFFVVDGRVVAGVCSDRNLCQMDTRIGRRLDERIAVIERPAGDAGSYDRGRTSNVVDRGLAAQFAIHARRAAKAMRQDGFHDYVIDIGLTERGVAAIEINELHLSGPYALDHDLVASAHRRTAERQRTELARTVQDLSCRLGAKAQAEAIAQALVLTPAAGELLGDLQASPLHDNEDDILSDLLQKVAAHIIKNRKQYGIAPGPTPEARDFVTWSATENDEMLAFTDGREPLFRLPYWSFRQSTYWNRATESIHPVRTGYVGWLTKDGELALHKEPLVSGDGVEMEPGLRCTTRNTMISGVDPFGQFEIDTHRLEPGWTYSIGARNEGWSPILQFVHDAKGDPVLRVGLRKLDDAMDVTIDIALPETCRTGIWLSFKQRVDA